MNRRYSLALNASTGLVQPVPETARQCRGGAAGSTHRSTVAWWLLAAALVVAPCQAGAADSQGGDAGGGFAPGGAANMSGATDSIIDPTIGGGGGGGAKEGGLGYDIPDLASPAGKNGGGLGGAGGAGGTAALLETMPAGPVTGGAGEAGEGAPISNGISNGGGGGGGAGGIGWITLNPLNGLVLSPMAFFGGRGGDGGDSAVNGTGLGGGGGGGNGGAGINIFSLTSLSLLVVPVQGGDGGDGGRAGGGDGGSGGQGGSAIDSWISGAVQNFGGTLRGGQGGRGGDSTGRRAGNGGAGGSALVGRSWQVENSARIFGGKGGQGGDGNGLGSAAGNGGDGGIGILSVNAQLMSITNDGVIAGGDGGKGGIAPGGVGADGAGGVAIVASGSETTIRNGGAITGGLGGDGITRADAIRFAGIDNKLYLEPGSSILGNVVASGATDALILAGQDLETVTVGNFDVTAIGPAAQYRNFSVFRKEDVSRWILTGATASSTSWTLAGGTLAIAGEAALGAVGSTLTFDGGTLATTGTFGLRQAAVITLAGGGVEAGIGNFSMTGTISGAGGLKKTGDGTLTLTGANSYAGGTTVSAGTLWVNNTTGSATGSGNVLVSNGAVLGGSGTIAGAVTIADGGTLSAGNSLGTLNTGALTFGSGSILEYELGQVRVPGGLLNDLVNVNGSLVLDGTLNLTQSLGGHFGPGLYRLINYTGSLIDNGLEIGDAPVAASELQVQTSVAKQINLINRAGATLNFWDGSNAVDNDGNVEGGAGTWRMGGPADGWTNMTGDVNTGWTPNEFAMFVGTAGRVTVDDSGGNVSIGGAQFFVDGYVVDGDALTLGKPETVIRVGDGMASGGGMTATIDSVITGAGGLTKDDAGTLVLNGANDYTGGTTVRAGVLQGNTVSLQGDIVNNARVTFDQPVDSTYAGTMSGTGSLRKIGVGELQLAAVNSYGGGTQVDAGTVNAAITGALGTGAVFVAGDAALIFSGTTDAGNLQITAGPVQHTNGGFIQFKDTSSAGNARITNQAGGSTHFMDDGSAGQATLVNETGGAVDFFDRAKADQATVVNNAGGTVRIGNIATAGIAIGALEGAGQVLLGAKMLTTGGLNTDTEVSGVISGVGGSVVKVGTGALTLSGANTYTGGTVLHEGRLNVGHSEALGTGALAMDDDTTLGFSADGVTISNAIQLTGLNDPVIDTGAFNGALSGGISGGGFITKEGTGTLTLSGANTYTGATHVAQGTLKAGATNTFSASSAHSVASGATLDLAGFNQSVASLSNSGTVSLVGAAPGATLTVNGAYIANNGVLKLSTALNGTGASDRLVLDGVSAVASGKTSVQITNLGGLGALTSGDGIEVIAAQNGATTTAQTTKDAFALAGGHVDAGAYEYRLNAADANGAGENWYLRSTLHAVSPGNPADVPVITYRAEAALYSALPSQLRQGNLAMLGDLRKRVGDDDVKGTAIASAGTDRRAWGRVLSTDIDIQQGGTVSPTSEGRLTGFQAGTDLLATPNWRAGLYVGQLDGGATVNGFASGVNNLRTGRNDLRDQYVGVYGTYTGDSGFYADAVVQSGRHRYTVQSNIGTGAEGKGNSLLGSIEVGLAFPLGGSGWRIEPQLQLIHQHLDLGNSAILGAVVQPQADDGWIARAGVRVKGEIDTGMGALQPYGRFNVYKTSSGTDIARFVNGATTTDIAAPTGGTSTELAGGFTLALSQTTSLYGEIGKLWSSGGDAKVKSSINGSLGVRVKW